MLITARGLFDGRTPQVLADPVVEVADGRIVGVRADGSRARGMDVLDLGDATLLPGLIDVHQHLAFDASSDPVARIQSDDDATLLLRMRLAARRALAAGITTIRDLGDRNYLSLTLRDWFRSGAEIGPRIIASGPPITVTGGHCWFLGGAADGVEFSSVPAISGRAVTRPVTRIRRRQASRSRARLRRPRPANRIRASG